MIIKKAVEQVIDSGVKPIILDAKRVLNFSSGLEGVRTSLVIRSLDLGVLTASQYRYVARRTAQGSKLVERNVEKLFFFYPDMEKEFDGAKFYSISVYARSLLGGALAQTLTEFFEKYPYVNPQKICLELSADILFEDIVTYKKEINNLKQLGVKIALCEVGQEYCPLFRLKELDYDFVFLDGYLIDALEDENRENEVNGAMCIISNNKSKIYGSCVKQEIIPLLEKVGANGYTLEIDGELEEKEWRVGGKEKWI